MAPETPPVKDRSHWPQAKFTSFDEARAYRINQWQEAGCSARLTAAWELVVDYWVGMKGMNPDELRLQRSVTHLTRGGERTSRQRNIQPQRGARR